VADKSFLFVILSGVEGTKKRIPLQSITQPANLK
jgi:hypothetical protein